jgi:hypothetical protein
MRLAITRGMRHINTSEEPYEEIEVQEPPRRRLRRDDEPTLEIDIERPELRPESKVVVGYLTMEAHGMFDSLSPDEQEQVAENLLSG